MNAAESLMYRSERAGGFAVLHHGRRETVQLEEVDPTERAPILRRHLEVAPAARSFTPIDRRAPLAAFDQVAANYPVLRIRSVPLERGHSCADVISPRHNEKE